MLAVCPVSPNTLPPQHKVWSAGTEAIPMLDSCSIVKSFTSARSCATRHSKRRCCEASAPTSQLHKLPRSQTFQCSQSDKASHGAVDSTQRPDTDSTSSPHQHITQIEACLQPFVTAESRWWDWKYNSRIHYRQQGSSGPCLLLVHGFGVGSFHFEHLIQKLSCGYQVWAIDLLGQGLSWPATAPAPGNNVVVALIKTHCLSSRVWYR